MEREKIVAYYNEWQEKTELWDTSLDSFIAGFRKAIQLQEEQKANETVNDRQAMKELNKGDWEEDFELENGKYFRKCIECGKQFQGHKRRLICKECVKTSVRNVQRQKKNELFLQI